MLDQEINLYQHTGLKAPYRYWVVGLLTLFSLAAFYWTSAVSRVQANDRRLPEDSQLVLHPQLAAARASPVSASSAPIQNTAMSIAKQLEAVLSVELPHVSLAQITVSKDGGHLELDGVAPDIAALSVFLKKIRQHPHLKATARGLMYVKEDETAVPAAINFSIRFPKGKPL